MNISPNKVFSNPIHFIAFGFGAGLIKFLPGTFGTLVGVILYLILHSVLPFLLYIIFLFIFTFFSIWICGKSAKMLGVHDYPGIVLDEIVGFLWCMVAVQPSWYTILLAFIIFRIFDIWKPWPIRWLDQNLRGGWGIVLDDVLAGIFTFIVLQILMFFRLG